MIEANMPQQQPVVEPVDKPQRITTTMIIDDLENGIGRDGIQTKYGLEKWEVTQMFQHPVLKGKKAKKVRKLSFEFVDDITDEVDPRQTSMEFDKNDIGSATIEEVEDFESSVEDAKEIDAVMHENDIDEDTNDLY